MTMRSFNGSRPKKYFYQSHYKGAGFSGLGRRKPMGRPAQRIDPARFINEAIHDEGIENYVPQHEFQDFKIDRRLITVVAGKG